LSGGNRKNGYFGVDNNFDCMAACCKPVGRGRTYLGSSERRRETGFNFIRGKNFLYIAKDRRLTADVKAKYRRVPFVDVKKKVEVRAVFTHNTIQINESDKTRSGYCSMND
jgi:hypothetical protein